MQASSVALVNSIVDPVYNSHGPLVLKNYITGRSEFISRI